MILAAAVVVVAVVAVVAVLVVDKVMTNKDALFYQ